MAAFCHTLASCWLFDNASELRTKHIQLQAPRCYWQEKENCKCTQDEMEEKVTPASVKPCINEEYSLMLCPWLGTFPRLPYHRSKASCITCLKCLGSSCEYGRSWPGFSLFAQRIGFKHCGEEWCRQAGSETGLWVAATTQHILKVSRLGVLCDAKEKTLPLPLTVAVWAEAAAGPLVAMDTSG